MGSTPQSKDPMVEYIVKEFERYESAHSDRFDIAKEIYSQWLNEPPRKDNSWNNAIHIPMTFEGEQTITPRIFSALFPSESPIDVVIDGEVPGIDLNAVALRIKSHIQHHFKLSTVDIEAMAALSQTTLLGTGYLYLPWLFRRKWMQSNGVRYKAVTDNRPSCEVVDFFEMYPHPAKIKVDDDLPLIRRKYCDAEYLKRLAAMPQFAFKNLDQALKSDPISKTLSSILDDNGKLIEMKKREEYEVLEYWGPWDESYKDDKGEAVKKEAVPYWIMVVNRSVCIRAIPNPYNHQMPPFVKCTLYGDIKKNWFGIGIGQVGKPTQERINKVVNQRLDNVDLVLNKQGVYNGNDPLINTKKLQVSKPGQFHKVSDVNGSIKFLDTPDVTASSYKEEEIAKADYRESTGAAEALMPTAEQHRTASGINMLQGAAGMRFRPVVRKLEIELVQQVCFIYLSNLQQFMTMPEWIKLKDPMGKETPFLMKPEDIQYRANFIPTGLTESANKEIQVSQLLRFKEVTVQDPTINRAYINKRIGELMGLRDLDKIIVDQKPTMMGPGQLPPEAQQMIQQRLAEGATQEQIQLEMLGQPPQEPDMEEMMMEQGNGG